MFGVTKRTLAVGLAAGGLVSSAGLAAAALTQGTEAPLVQGATKVTICHATSSEKNPYVQLQVDDDSIVREGHGDHEGDIIPPFDYIEDGKEQRYPGKNWDEAGQKIHTDGCEVPQPPQPIQLSAKCVDVEGPTFEAVFGYTNPNGQAVTITSVSENRFSPAPGDRGQPTTFQPGVVESAVTFTWEASVTWTVSYAGKESSATAVCSTTPPPDKPPIGTEPVPITLTVKCILDRGSTFDATFGYGNENEAAVEIPVGERNSVTLPGGPRPAGQPTTFAVGTVTTAFTVSDVPAGADVEWNVTYAGVTSTASANEAWPDHCSEDPPDPRGRASNRRLRLLRDEPGVDVLRDVRVLQRGHRDEHGPDR